MALTTTKINDRNDEEENTEQQQTNQMHYENTKNPYEIDLI